MSQTKKVKGMRLPEKMKSLGHGNKRSVSPRDYTFVKRKSLSSVLSPRRSPNTQLTLDMYQALSLDPIKNYNLIKSILHITLELVNNHTFFRNIMCKDICDTFLVLLVQAKNPNNFINFCLDEEMKKKDYNSIFRENTPTNNAVLKFMEIDNDDNNFVSKFASKYIEDKEYSNFEILDLITGIVNQFFVIAPFYPSSFFYVLRYIHESAEGNGKDPYKIITILLFLRVIGPAITRSCNPTDSISLTKNKTKVIKKLLSVTSEMILNESYLQIQTNSEEEIKIYNLKELIHSKLILMDLSRGKKVHYNDTSIDFNIVLKFCSYILDNRYTIQLNDTENIEMLVITNICKLIATMGCGEKDKLTADSKILIKKLLQMSFIV